MDILQIYQIAKDMTPDNLATTVVLYFLVKRDIKKMLEKEKPGLFKELKELVTSQVEIIRSEISTQIDKLVGAINGLDSRVTHLEAQGKNNKQESGNESGN